MTDSPEPTLSEVMAVLLDQGQALAALASKVDRVEAGVARVEVGTSQMRTEVGVRFDLADAKAEEIRNELKADVAQVRADVLGVKVDHGLHERHQADIQQALVRHVQDPDGHRRAA